MTTNISLPTKNYYAVYLLSIHRKFVVLIMLLLAEGKIESNVYSRHT